MRFIVKLQYHQVQRVIYTGAVFYNINELGNIKAMG